MRVTRGSSRRRRRLRGSRGSGGAVANAAPATLAAVPSRAKRLSDGVLVEASVVGRVLGLRLLTVRASVVLAPAEVTGAPSAHPDLPVRAATPAAPVRPTRGRAAGRELAEAVRRIDEGARLLAEVRRDDLSPARDGGAGAPVRPSTTRPAGPVTSRSGGSRVTRKKAL
jgi:hypothetical protein